MAEASQIIDIRDAYRRRNFAAETIKRQSLALGSFLRLQFGWQRPNEDAPKSEKVERERINTAAAARAGAVMKAAEDMARTEAADRPNAGDDELMIAVGVYDAMAPMLRVRRQEEKELHRLAMNLPVWERFCDGVAGFGPLGLATIVAEAGDLCLYANPGKLWRRMGLAPIAVGNDGRNRLPSTFLSPFRPNALSAKEWSEIGYAPRRRSALFAGVTEPLLKKKNAYYALYLERKAYEHAKAEAALLIPATTVAATAKTWADKGLPPLTVVKKINPDIHRSASHIDAMARVYAEKRFLRDLWKAWWAASGLKEPSEPWMQNAA